MFAAFFGLGAQEILILLLCAGGFFTIVAVAVVLIAVFTRPKPPDGADPG
jgi:hypothetical protein